MKIKKRPNVFLNHFIKGLSIIVPFGVIIYFTWYAVYKTNVSVYSLLQYFHIIEEVNGDNLGSRLAPLIAIFITCIAIAFIGYLGSTFLFAPLISWLESLVMRIPILNILYSYTKESTFGFIDKLNQPVMVKITYGEYEVYKIGFLTQDRLHALPLMENEVAVYLPHSYALSGEMTIFPKEQVTSLDISTTEAMLLVLTGGLARIKRPLVTSRQRGTK